MKSNHIILNSHPTGDQRPVPIQWGATDLFERGPIVGTPTSGTQRNAIGSHSGAYSIYRALAVAAGSLHPLHKPDLTDTSPAIKLGPHPQWSGHKIVSIDPLGHMVSELFSKELENGLDIRPTIAVTKARLSVPELVTGHNGSDLKSDGEILTEGGELNVTKIAIEPVWFLPGIAQRFDTTESDLRRSLFEQTGGMYSELVTRPDLELFLPPIGGITCYIVGDPEAITDPQRALSCRVHDECNGSDVFGSDICTCRPYLIHGIEDCVETAQQGGVGLIVYNRKEGRALGEVTKFLVYNARKRQKGGDTADAYFERTECVAGVQDVRFQELMPDVLHWLGVTRIDRFVSMSNMKFDAITGQGIEIVQRIPIREGSIPDDAKVEMEAKKAAGYYSANAPSTETDLAYTQGRDLNDY